MRRSRSPTYLGIHRNQMIDVFARSHNPTAPFWPKFVITRQYYKKITIYSNNIAVVIDALLVVGVIQTFCKVNIVI